MGFDSDTGRPLPCKKVARLVQGGVRGKRRSVLPTEAILRNQRHSEAWDRSQNRRNREDTAARLRAIVPEITSLVLELSEFRSEGSIPLVSYRKLVVVARAPALFVIPCSDADCDDGGHDITREIMRALNRHATDFSGRNVCFGHRTSERCDRRLEYRVVATYQPAAAPEPQRGPR
jgi:hypothetical protein